MDYTNPLELPSYPHGHSQLSQNASARIARKQFAVQYELALELRLDGVDYETIETELRYAGFTYTESSIRKWFSADGQPSLKKVYDEIKLQRTKDAIAKYEKARETLQENVPMAMAILQRSLHDKRVSNRQMEGAKEVLDRSGFGRQTKVEGAMQVESESMKRMAEALKAIAHRTS